MFFVAFFVKWIYLCILTSNVLMQLKILVAVPCQALSSFPQQLSSLLLLPPYGDTLDSYFKDKEDLAR